MTYKSKLLKKYMKYIIVNTFLLIISILFTFAGPIFLKYSLQNTSDKINIIKIFIIFFIFLFLTLLLKILINKIQYNFSYKFKVKETIDLYHNMFSMSYSSLTQKEPTYMVERINIAINTLLNFVSDSFSNIIVSTITIVISLILVFFINKLLFVLFIILLPLHYFGYNRLNKNLALKSQKLQDVCSRNFKDIISIVSNVDYIKQSGSSKGLLLLLKQNVCNIEKSNCTVAKFAKNLSQLLEFTINLIENTIYIYTVFLYLCESLPFSDMIFITLINSIFFSSIKQVTQIDINLRDLRGALDFIDSEILSNVEDNGTQSIENVYKIEGKIKKLGYDNVLINDGSFVVKPGDIIAVTGESGCGKSTLMKSLNKMMKTTDDIYINDININEINNKSLRTKISVISQNIFIAPISIKDNILLGEKINDNLWNELMKKDFMAKFINLKDGLNTIVKENGANLSGGDKQKISLARLFIHNPDVIILDEATNSLDKDTIDEILNDLIEEYTSKIIFIVTHDSYLLNFCNKQIIIDNKSLSFTNTK